MEEAIVNASKGEAGEKRPPIYNVDAIHDALEDIAWVEEADWNESLAITSAEATQVEDVDDDLGRELAFYNQVCASVRCGWSHQISLLTTVD